MAGDGSVTEAAVRRILVVGRAEACEVVVAHPSVSREHAELRLRSDGSILLVDLDSLNGTFVLEDCGPRKIESEVVSQRALLRLGNIEVSVAELLDSAVLGAVRWLRSVP